MRNVTTIDRPGEYLTRKGEVVRIVSSKVEEGVTVWSGWIMQVTSSGVTRKQWADWPSLAVFRDAPSFDIVAYVGA